MKLGFIGAGEMGTALAAGFVGAGRVNADHVTVFDIKPDAVNRFRELVPGAKSAESAQQALSESEMLFLAVKPQNLTDAVAHLDWKLGRPECVVSIVAGWTIERLSKLVADKPVVRVMPNTPCLVGAGASAIAGSASVSREQLERVIDLMRSVGLAIHVPERHLDAVTGLSGSGPAYVLTFLQAMVDGGVLCGLPREAAMTLTVQTIRGTLAMLESTHEHPLKLRERVISPGGTTIYGLKALSDLGFESAIMSCVLAATQRAETLACGGE